MIYLLKGDITKLIEAAATAAKDLFTEDKRLTTQAAMVFDCISRVSYMENAFENELKVINSHCVAPLLFGVLSIGEVANSKSGAINLLNKSTVITAW